MIEKGRRRREWKDSGHVLLGSVKCCLNPPRQRYANFCASSACFSVCNLYHALKLICLLLVNECSLSVRMSFLVFAFRQHWTCFKIVQCNYGLWVTHTRIHHHHQNQPWKYRLRIRGFVSLALNGAFAYTCIMELHTCFLSFTKSVYSNFQVNLKQSVVCYF